MLKKIPMQNDNSKTVYWGMLSPVSVFDEKVFNNQDHVYFLSFVFISYHEYSLMISDVNNRWKGIDFEDVILQTFIKFYKKVVALKIRE